MINLSLKEIASALGAKILTNNSNSGVETNVNDLLVSFVCTDTRIIKLKSKNQFLKRRK